METALEATDNLDQQTTACGPNPTCFLFCTAVNHSHTHLFMSCLWLYSYHNDRVELLRQRSHVATKIFTL